MPINPYRPIRGSSITFKAVINSPVAEHARAYVKKTDGTVIMPEIDMALIAPGVYTYTFQTTHNMSLTTYNVFTTIRLNGKDVKEKQAFVLTAD